MVTEINPKLCQGCGVCVAACPANAISGSGFSHDQIIAQIDGLLLDTSGAARRSVEEAVGATA